MHKTHSEGFTIIELLIVFAIIALLGTIALFTVNDARERAKVVQAAAQIRQLELLVRLYRADTTYFPPSCRQECTLESDPLYTKPDNYSDGWSGPYGKISGTTHPWGGLIGLESGYNIDGLGGDDYAIVLDDDRPGTSDADNQGAIPNSTLLKLDMEMDDGNLLTGRVRSDPDSYNADGELMYVVIFSN